MATIEIPPKFLFAHRLNLSNLVKSFRSAYSSKMFCAISLSGRRLALKRNSSAFNFATSAIDSYNSFLFGSPSKRFANSLQLFSSISNASILLSTVIPPCLCCFKVGSFAFKILLNSLSSFSVNFTEISSKESFNIDSA